MAARMEGAIMKLDDVKAIVAFMTENGLSEFEMEQDGVRISLKKGVPGAVAAALPPAPAAPPAAEEDAEPDEGFEEIKAPFVGTFYRAPAPDAEPYVTIGKEVEPDTVLCILEAMKVMNEIKAEMRGIVREILVKNAQAVQYGQPLFRIEKT